MTKNLKHSDFRIRGSEVYINTSKTNGQPGMLLIWAEWCGHCQNFKPVYERINRRIGRDFSMLGIEHDQLQKNTKLQSSLNYRGYPTIQFFDRTGKLTKQYVGGRSERELLKHICEFYHVCYS
jgi:thiol-disulfide isomerase/thioredoxin